MPSEPPESDLFLGTTNCRVWASSEANGVKSFIVQYRNAKVEAGV